MIPSLFAVQTGERTHRYNFNHSDIDIAGAAAGDDDFDFTTGRLHVYQARPCGSAAGGGGGGHHDPWDSHRDIPVRAYRVAPYRIHVNAEDRYYPAEASSFVVEGRFGFNSGGPHGDNPVILYNETHGPPPAADYEYYDDYTRRRGGDSCIYRGHWRYSGYTVFSMYCATPIPILVMTDVPARETIAWPSPNFNRIAVTAGDRVIVRAWTRRWNPATWTAEIEELYESRRARPAGRRGAASGGSTAAPSALSSPSAPLPKFVADLIIADAVAKRTTCPITMEPIRADNATVTPCYHIFDTAALTAWAASQDSPTICPQCRKHVA